jgi:hypothetical protein
MFNYFYHQKVRRSVAVFGSLFNNIYVLRSNSAGQVISQVKVPLSYAPKSKYLERIRQNPDLDEDTTVALKLPRMSFEITSMQYDAERKLPKMNNFMRFTDELSGNKAEQFFTPAPYLINFQLNIYAKTQDDALQMVEQIIPYFNPTYTITVKPFTEFQDVKEDIPITILSTSFSDDFEGAVEQRRTIMYTLDFEMRVAFYGPTTQSSLIRKVTSDLYLMGDSNSKIGTITVEPNPRDLDPYDLSADSDWGFSTEITNYVDSN